jgi:GGDEF domain-containing protein
MEIRFHTREELHADLEDAVEAQTPLRLFFVFRLSGVDHLNSKVGDAVAAVLLSEAANHIAVAIGPRAIYYRPRRDELCGLIAGNLTGVEQTLVSTLARLNDEHRAIGLSAGFGAVILPREAPSVAHAVSLADQRVAGVIDRSTPVLRGGSAADRALPREAPRRLRDATAA